VKMRIFNQLFKIREIEEIDGGNAEPSVIEDTWRVPPTGLSGEIWNCEKSVKLPMKLTNEMKSNFEITGMIQVTRNDMLNMFSEFTNQLRHEFRQQQQMEKNANTVVNNASSTEHSSTTATFETWHWGEKFHMVPQGFKLPLGLKVKAIWDLWYFGDKNAKIQPYKFLMGRNDLTLETDRVLLSKITFAMKVMNNIAVTMNFISVTTNIT